MKIKTYAILALLIVASAVIAGPFQRREMEKARLEKTITELHNQIVDLEFRIRKLEMKLEE